MAYGESDPFGTFPGEQPAPQQASRFNQMLHNPNMHAEARRIVMNVGGDALQGALEANGLVRDDGSIRKFRAVRKLVTNPTGVARRAATGAVQGAHQSVREEAFHQAQGAFGAVQERAANVWGQASQPNQDPWGLSVNTAASYAAPATESDPWGPAFPDSTAPNPFSTQSSPSYGAAPNANTYGWPDAQQTAPHQPDFGFGTEQGFPDSPTSPW